MKIFASRFLLICFAVISFLEIYAQERKVVTGTVRDASGNPVIAATVKEKGKTNATQTDANGKFSISVAEGANTALDISSVGFETKTIKVSPGEKTLTVTITASSQELNEVVVTALGITKEARKLGYAASTIKADQIVKTGSTNFATALYGKAPGLKIAATPGGATSGVAVQIRGVNSINYKTQPLIIMDGVPVRNGEFDNGNYWGDQRIRSNGLVDFNTEDIESITVLKGASAAALYGSEATNGVIVIKTKSGKGKKGLGIDFNATYSTDKIAYEPRWQTVRGAGLSASAQIVASNNLDDDENGFGVQQWQGQTYRRLVSASINFGPKFDGQPILAWDQQVRPYSYQKGGYANLFQQAHNSQVNLALTNNTDKTTTRFSYTFQHTEGLSVGSKNDKHNFSLNNTFYLGKNVSTNIIINYMNWHIHNRPYQIDRLINNFTGMFPAFDNGDWYKAKYKTSLGYKAVRGAGTASLTPDENLSFPNYRGDLLDYMWNVMENNTDEYENRLNAVFKVGWDITKNLNLQVRGSTDYTDTRTVNKSTSDKPLLFGASGAYGVNTYNYGIVYGDVMLNYKQKLTQDVELTAMAGYNARYEKQLLTSVSSKDGLSIENKFDLSASYAAPYYSGSTQTNFLTDGLFGTLNANYRTYLYGEFTLRRDRTSTMFPNNAFWYPSANVGFVISDAFKMPDVISYLKLRSAWGIVGNYPPMYAANIVYRLDNLGDQGYGPVSTSVIKTSPFGNNYIKPERKTEIEFGLEGKALKNRLGFDITYFNDRIDDQILNLTIPQSSGAGSIISNVGTLRNTGIEIGLTGTPFRARNFSWDITLNFTKIQNKIEKLASGQNELLHWNADGDAMKSVSQVGQPMGDFYSHPIMTNDKGEKMVNDDGTWAVDGSKWVKVGNKLPKGYGGFINTFSYKNFQLDLVMDYRFGGYDYLPSLFWLSSRGLTQESLTGMDKEHGGMSYYLDASNNNVGVATSASAGPNGEKVYNDGILLDGVKSDGKKNDIVIPQAIYYWYEYNWGGPQYGGSNSSLYYMYVLKNSYIKMREISLTYKFGTKIASKLHANNLTFSVFARNPFYLYRTIKDMDSEQATTGSSWNSGGLGTNPSSRTFGVMLRANF